MKDYRSYTVACLDIETYKKVLDLMNTQQYDKGYYDKSYESIGMGVEISPMLDGIFGLVSTTEIDKKNTRIIHFDEFKKLINNKNNLINKNKIMKKKFKKGVVTTTKEVTKKVPMPKYSTLKEYMLHIEGKRVIYLSPLYATYHKEDEQWYYYINNTIFEKSYLSEKEFTKALINNL